MHVPGVHAARAAHILRHGRRLAAGRGAGVQHVHAGLDHHRLRGQQRGRALHAEFARRESGIQGEIALPAHGKRARYGRFFVVPAAPFEGFLEAFGRIPHKIGANGFAVNVGRVSEHRAGKFQPVRGDQPLDQRLRHRIRDGQVRHRLFRLVRRRQLARVARAGERAQHAVDKPGLALKAKTARELRRFVHYGKIGNFVHIQKLRRREQQNRHHHIVRFGNEPAQIVFQLQAVLHRRVKQIGGQPAVVRRKAHAFQRAAQRQLRVSALIQNIIQRAQRCAARVRARLAAATMAARPAPWPPRRSCSLAMYLQPFSHRDALAQQIGARVHPLAAGRLDFLKLHRAARAGHHQATLRVRRQHRARRARAFGCGRAPDFQRARARARPGFTPRTRLTFPACRAQNRFRPWPYRAWDHTSSAPRPVAWARGC